MTSHYILAPRDTKRLIVLCLVLLTFALSVQTVAAANPATVTSSVGSDGVFRAMTKGDSLASITFHLSETSGIETQIMLYTDGLMEQNGASSIETQLITITCAGQPASQPYTLPAGGLVDVTLTVDTKNVNAGIYKGNIMVQQTNSTSLAIPVKIQVSESMLWPALLNLAGVLVGFVFVILGSPNLKEQIGPIVAFIIVTVVVWATAFVAYYPKVTAFGATPVDYFAAFLFGLAQVGAAKITADMLKGKKA